MGSKRKKSIENSAPGTFDTSNGGCKKKNVLDIDIDELFSVLKDKKKEEVTKRADEIRYSEEREKKQRKKETRNKNNIEGSNGRVIPPGLILPTGVTTFIISPEAPLERIDKDSGLPVYKAHLLKVGEGGGTSLCPFDCTCCF